MRISRPCYDKFRRCPGWAGSGCKYAKVERCAGGYINFNPERRLWKWRLYRCDSCDVVVLPYVIRWIDPCWWRWEWDRLKFWAENKLWRWRNDRR